MTTRILTTDQRWAQDMADQQAGQLFKALLRAQSSASGVIEFGEGTPTDKVAIDAEIRDTIPRTVEVLQDLYNGSVGR